MNESPRSEGGALPVSRRCFGQDHDHCRGEWTSYPDSSGPCECACHHAAPITRAEGITPYATYGPFASSDDCDYCAEGAEIDTPHSHAYYVHREGGNTRTADDLCAAFLSDVESLTTWRMDDEIRAIAESTESHKWLDDSDDSQALNDECNGAAESALSDAGFSAYWEDGFIIEEIIETPDWELAEIAAKLGAEHGANAATWVIDGNTSTDSARRILDGINDCDSAILDALPSAPNREAAASWHHSEATPMQVVALTSTDIGYYAYVAAYVDALESGVAERCAYLLSHDVFGHAHDSSAVQS